MYIHIIILEIEKERDRKLTKSIDVDLINKLSLD